MADKRQMELLRNLLIQQANTRKRSFLIGPTRRVNGAAIARATGISEPEINRILRLTPAKHQTIAGARVKDWHATGEILAGIMGWLGYTSLADFWDACENAPEAPPPPPTKQKGKSKQPA